jgi:hypothetical protein
VTRRFAIFAATLTVLFGVTSCDYYQHFRTPTTAEISGSYVHEESGRKSSKIEFQTDGTFVAANLPSNLFDDGGNDPLNLDELIDCEGTWAVGKGDEQSNAANPYLDISIDSCTTGAGAITVLFVWGQADDLELYRFVGDGDNGIRFVFERQNS